MATTAPTDVTTGATLAEVAGGSYARVGVTGATDQWKSTNGTTSGASTGTGGTTNNANAITFTTASADWGTVVAVAITDNATTAAGNILFWGSLTANKVVSNGDTFQFTATNLSVQLDN